LLDHERIGVRPRLAKPKRAWAIAVAVLAASTGSRSAAARAGGIVAGSCYGCHGNEGSRAPELMLSAEPPTFNPGDAVTLTLAIRSPAMRVGGAFITAGGVGMLQAVSGQGLAMNAQGLTHNVPRGATDDVVTFRFGWRAPATPGSVVFGVAALAGNGNGASSGDAPTAAEFQWVFGCQARDLYPDLDRDGFGSKDLGRRLGCSEQAAPVGYTPTDGDCDENSEKVYPGASEICNRRDDDCDGRIDEDAPPVTLWPDSDGDGYYESQTGSPKQGCGNVTGYAANGGDCDGAAPSINPGAAEQCNNVDDDCDGDVDELVRPRCGVGWCSRYSPTCNPSDCRPGPPALETCNRFDDDCDGEDDNGACPAGMSCSGAGCVSNGGGAGSTPTPTDSSSAGSAPAQGGVLGNSRDAGTAGGCALQGVGRSRPDRSYVMLVVCLGLGCLRARSVVRPSGRHGSRTRSQGCAP
jgi:hypothetical protein